MNIFRRTVSIGIAIFAGSVSAHHGPSFFDQDRTSVMTGVVTSIKWSNPHVEIVLEGQDEDGAPVIWIVEASPPHQLVRVGVPSDFISIGDNIEITGHPAIEAGRIAAWAISVLHADESLTRLPEQANFQRVSLTR